MEWDWILIGLMAVAALSLATWADIISNTRSDLLSAGFILFLSWPLASVVDLIFTPPESMLIAPITDALFVSWLLYSLRRQYEAWKVMLIGLVATQAFLHVAYQVGHYQPHMLYFYVVALNSTYALQLLVVGIVGGRNVLSHYRLSGVRGLRPLCIPDGHK